MQIYVCFVDEQTFIKEKVFFQTFFYEFMLLV